MTGYNSNNKNDQSGGIETSNILEIEKLSDNLSFTLNFKDIIGSIEEKTSGDVEKMKHEL